MTAFASFALILATVLNLFAAITFTRAARLHRECVVQVQRMEEIDARIRHESTAMYASALSHAAKRLRDAGIAGQDGVPEQVVIAMGQMRETVADVLDTWAYDAMETGRVPGV